MRFVLEKSDALYERQRGNGEDAACGPSSSQEQLRPLSYLLEAR